MVIGQSYSNTTLILHTLPCLKFIYQYIQNMKALGLKIKNSTLYKVVLEEVKEEFMSIKYVSLQ